MRKRSLNHNADRIISYKKHIILQNRALTRLNCLRAYAVASNKVFVDGNETPVESNRTPVEGDGALVVSNGSSVQGNEPLVESDERLVGGNGTSVESNKTVVDGNDATVESNGSVVKSNDVFVEGNKTVVVGEKSVVDGNHCPVEINCSIAKGNNATVPVNQLSNALPYTDVDGNNNPADVAGTSHTFNTNDVFIFNHYFLTKNSYRMATDYVPRNDSQLAVWLSNLATKIGVHGQMLGLTTDEVSAAMKSCSDTSTQITAIEQKKTEVQHQVAIKDEVKKASLLIIRGFATRMKAHPAYTEALGYDMGIIAPNGSAKVTIDKSTLKAESLPGKVRISFTKKGFAGVNIYSRLEGASKWTLLGRDNNSPYDDARPLTNAGQPEKREYMAMGVVGDEEVGQPSDIVSVVFGG